MTITRDDVLHIARLSRLELADDEVETYRASLSDILGYVEKLDELDTEDIEPTTHAVETRMRLRDDDVDARLTCEDVLSNAPASQDGMFEVPKIVDAG